METIVHTAQGNLLSKESDNLKKHNPKLAKEWDYKKNKTRPEEHTPKVHHKVWWLCSYKTQLQSKHCT